MTADLAHAEAAEPELRLQRQLAAEAYAAGYDDGRRDGIDDTIGWYKRLLANTVADAQVEQRRRHVCCGRCRHTGHRHGCTRCEDRGRATFGNPHPDDYRGQAG